MTDIPSITLGDRDWNIPVLAPKQNRIIVPGLAKLAGDDPSVRYELLLDICYTAITRAYPETKRDEFENMPVTTTQLFAALPVIAGQAGVATLPKE